MIIEKQGVTDDGRQKLLVDGQEFWDLYPDTPGVISPSDDHYLTEQKNTVVHQNRLYGRVGSVYDFSSREINLKLPELSAEEEILLSPLRITVTAVVNGVTVKSDGIFTQSTWENFSDDERLEQARAAIREMADAVADQIQQSNLLNP